mmetsp:Transcript_102421/g.330452  ORF Transcript_102421/g.330452 Transcript_102421/m.330452 type:complete len:229 (-) Transcript_102421:2621-3307(-)
MTMLLKGSPTVPTPFGTASFLSSTLSLLARFRMSAKLSSMSNLPSLKTSTRASLAGSPLPSVTVVHLVAPLGNFSPESSKVSRPFLDFLPGSVIGSLTTSTFSPLIMAYEHLKAHFCVSRCSFCSRAPPLPKARLSAAQPAAVMVLRIISRVLMSMPSPWMTRICGGNSLWPVGVFDVPNLPANFSSTSSTILGSSPLSGRTTRMPSRFKIMSLSSVPQYCSQATKMS